MRSSSIEIIDLEKTFFSLRGRVRVLKRISFDVKPGEFFVLLGPSGCGKSTLLNLVAGLEKPSGGSIHIDGGTVADSANDLFVDPFHRDIAMVFQSYALYPHMNVRDNIAFPLTNSKPKLSRAEIDARVRDTARLLRIDDLLERKPAELSGGQRQRVAIGRAVVRKPKVFLMDEPLSNLDARLRTDMRAQLKDLQRTLAITTIYVTHDQMEAMTLGDRIAVLNDGYIQQLATPADVYDNPANVFVARFIGSPAMNLLEGMVRTHDDAVWLENGGMQVRVPASVAGQLSRDGTATLGIRPENVEIVSSGSGNLDADIDVIENIGAAYLVHFFLPAGRIVASVPVRPASKHVGLRFNPERMHVFDK